MVQGEHNIYNIYIYIYIIGGLFYFEPNKQNLRVQIQSIIITKPHHTTPHYTNPHHTNQTDHTTAHHTTPCHTTPNHATPHHTTPHHTTPHHTTPHHTTPHHTTPYHTTPHHATPTCQVHWLQGLPTTCTTRTSSRPQDQPWLG